MPAPDAKTLCLTIGDADGIGPEITAKFLADSAYHANRSYRLMVLGPVSALEDTAKKLGLILPQADEHLSYVSTETRPDTPIGEVSYLAVKKAVEAIAAGQAHGVVTGPISKAHLQAAGLPYHGHTEMLDTLSQGLFSEPGSADMLFVYKGFRLILLTRHIPLSQVSSALSPDSVFMCLENLVRFLQGPAGIEKPSICLLGVNPHAGELGGGEEEAVLLPVIERINTQYGLAIGKPLPADAVFRGFNVDSPPYDAYVAAYHDQGLIPFKLVAGLQAVNVTIGLPFFRTSVSHGTANDIAGQGIADPTSLYSAIALLDALASNSKKLI
jgi:4-hydroxythreonine-4-phosphate dehydrogenase